MRATQAHAIEAHFSGPRIEPGSGIFKNPSSWPSRAAILQRTLDQCFTRADSLGKRAREAVGKHRGPENHAIAAASTGASAGAKAQARVLFQARHERQSGRSRVGCGATRAL